MAAGDSSREVAQRAARAAEALRKKADAAARMSDTFSLGAEGEVNLSQTLAPLAAKGWLALSDRQAPHGGNVDEVMIGPAGVIVIDAKNWSYAVRTKGDDLFTGRYSRSAALDGVLGQVEAVTAILAEYPFRPRVQGMLALVGEPDRRRHPEVVRGVALVGLDRIVHVLKTLEGQLNTSQVEEIFRTLSKKLPPMSQDSLQFEEVQRAPVKVHKLFDKNARFFYLHTWKKSGKYRLYLRSSDGSDLGWKDLNAAQVTITCAGDDARLVRAVLESATPTGVTLSGEDLPKVALAFPGGKILSKLGPIGAPVLVGQEWKSRGAHRLYGTLIYPGDAAFTLGFVDLNNGKLVPAVNGRLGKDYGFAVTYLQLLAERQPRTAS